MFDETRYAYVGPPAIRDRARGEPGAAIVNTADLERWLAANPDAAGEGATYVVDLQGRLRLAPRRSEHIDCAGGQAVLAAGEIRFGRAADRRIVVPEVSNPSTGYCRDPDCWRSVAAALTAAGVDAPAFFTRAFVFRRCPACAEINLVKDDWFACAACDAELPRAWNFAAPAAQTTS
ncbi:hypothetical protein SAMN02745121_01448 [Nannocystis exedens]|uniref:Uncharacterized protein n=1 Tax=Nannocystis exedens TaxID=54 RepID=A0A1I1UZY6_9BACT|nr:hypothetical protein [Nannocystis exedens]PCC72248.1 hypothetical protein NAEX_05327 [Nannocystis exedens]SFD76382.1 hypothetical protein SAMN02745121_01448 [Nannocystis exedens]